MKESINLIIFKLQSSNVWSKILINTYTQNPNFSTTLSNTYPPTYHNPNCFSTNVVHRIDIAGRSGLIGAQQAPDRPAMSILYDPNFSISSLPISPPR